MIEVGYEFADDGGRSGLLVVRGGIWAGDECVFEFTETVTGVTGTIRCDWRKPGPDFEVHCGDPGEPSARKALESLREILLPFHSGAFAEIDDTDLAALYAGAYHDRQNYSNNSDYETAYKRRFLDTLLAISSPRKLLDAGCSAGEVVRQLRQRGVDAHGFDLSRDLHAIAYPEVRDRVRRGSVTAIPYGPDDEFDTLTAFDVFEHIPEHRLPDMVAEFARLGVRRVFALIAMCEFQCLGHVTLRPPHWWDRLFAPHFRRCHDGRTLGAMARALGTRSEKYLAIYDLVRVPELVV
jgi:SAM-dependent methyltransferase